MSRVTFVPVPATSRARPPLAAAHDRVEAAALLARQRGRFAGRAGDDEGIGSAAHDEIDEAFGRALVERAVLERCDQGDRQAFEHGPSVRPRPGGVKASRGGPGGRCGDRRLRGVRAAK